MLKRRTVLKGAGGTTAASLLASPAAHADETAPAGRPGHERIDREKVVARHAIERTASDPGLPLQVGNGNIAFGADITGLQTFLPFATMSQWGWHEDPLPEGQKLEDYQGTAWDTYGRPIRYWTDEAGHPDLYNWLRGNPHRINLGRIGLSLRTSGGREATEADLTGRHQRLDLWTGILTSRFTFDGAPVTVETACHPTLDAIAVRVDSPLVETGRLTVYVDFPYATAEGQGKFSAPFVGFWDRPDAHSTELRPQGAARARITHRMDDTAYHVALTWNAAAGKLKRNGGGHRRTLTGARGRRIELTCLFYPDDPRGDGARTGAPPAASVARAAAGWWPEFWRSGGAVDLSGSRDPRWRELERRIVHSQFSMAVNESGQHPPQESGLVNNGWFGKFHMEMIVWHSAHHALWKRWPLLDRSLGVYRDQLPSALERARRQGFRGARWTKMTSPEGRDSPGLQNALLLWQMPHPIFFAELEYRARPDPGHAPQVARRRLRHGRLPRLVRLPRGGDGAVRARPAGGPRERAERSEGHREPCAGAVVLAFRAADGGGVAQAARPGPRPPLGRGAGRPGPAARPGRQVRAVRGRPGHVDRARHRPSGPDRPARDAAGRRCGRPDDAGDGAAGVRELAGRRPLQLGLSGAGDERRAPGRPGPGRRLPAAPEVRLHRRGPPGEREGGRAVAVLPGRGRAAVRGRADVRGLGRRPGSERSRLPRRRLDRAVGGTRQGHLTGRPLLGRGGATRPSRGSPGHTGGRGPRETGSVTPCV
ncbi:hypothetical protein GCM10010191_17200 [Actinomadura vinacea]|uniref:Tat pathway signal sequence domain protein n=1 Tax=Actinomadura vinacea TaxID=115336 RepID=A0ABP5VTE0_9ACTN